MKKIIASPKVHLTTREQMISNVHYC